MIIGLLVAVGAVVVPLAIAANNAGDVKVHNPGDNGEQRNEPHVGCTFFVEGFNMDATSGAITFRVWPPSGDKSIVHATGAAETWTADDTNAHGNHHFVSGPYHLPKMGDHKQGTHYKVSVTDTKHDKFKVFWTKCEETPPPCTENCNPTPPPCTENCNPTPPPCTENCNPTPPPCTENCNPTPPTTEVPFFPSLGSMIAGIAGAVGTAFVALRRRG